MHTQARKHTRTTAHTRHPTAILDRWGFTEMLVNPTYIYVIYIGLTSFQYEDKSEFRISWLDGGSNLTQVTL